MPDRPQDVPDELLLVALSAWTGKTLRSLYDLIEVDGDEHGAMERTLRALLPEIKRRVREQVAAEARFAASQVGRHSDFDWDARTLLWFADRIGEGR